MHTPNCTKIRTFCDLEDKYKVQLKLFQNRCQLLLDVRGGSYEHANRFTKPMSTIVLFGAFIYYLLSTGGSKPPCAILFGNDLRVGLHIFVLSILKLLNAKDEES